MARSPADVGSRIQLVVQPSCILHCLHLKIDAHPVPHGCALSAMKISECSTIYVDRHSPIVGYDKSAGYPVRLKSICVLYLKWIGGTYRGRADRIASKFDRLIKSRCLGLRVLVRRFTYRLPPPDLRQSGRLRHTVSLWTDVVLHGLIYDASGPVIYFHVRSGSGRSELEQTSSDGFKESVLAPSSGWKEPWTAGE